MRNVLLALLHLAVTAAKLCGAGGVRAVMAENLLLKQQLLVLRRARKRAPNLTSSDRLLCGFWSIFLSPGRIRKAAIALQPSTLLAFHQALVRRKYRQFSSTPCRRKPGPKGPSDALIQAIVELKSRNPRFGCPRIAHIISQTFGVDIDNNLAFFRMNSAANVLVVTVLANDKRTRCPESLHRFRATCSLLRSNGSVVENHAKSNGGAETSASLLYSAWLCTDAMR